MNKGEIYAAVFEDYEKDREYAENRARAVKRKVYKENPRLAEIDSEIMEKGVELFRSCVSNTKDDNASSKFKNAVNALNSEKKYILKRAGYTPEYLEPKYKCSICKDTGVVNTKRCKCFNKRLAERLYELSNISEMLEKENFNTFDYNIFSKDPGERGISPHDTIRRLCIDVAQAVDNIDKKPIRMLFYGNSGLGKTFMCNCIAKSLIDKGCFVVYMSAYKLFSYMTRFRFGKENEAEAEAVKLLNECDMLVIDDLGTEGVNSGTIPELFDIINTRLLANKSILISTNLDLEDINKTYSERIFSRITGNFKIYEFIGSDLRLK